MGVRTVTVKFDDLTGEDDPSAATVRLAFEGVQYELDLGERSRAALAEALQPFLAVATSTSGRTNGSGTKTKRRHAKASVSDRDIRAWAVEYGIEVNAKGRLPDSIREAYFQAH